MRISIVIPALDEARALPALAASIACLDPPPHEVLLVDGGSADETMALAQGYGWRTVASARGRGVQVNTGVEAATGEGVVVLHADTLLPPDALVVVAQTLADPRIALAGFTPLIRGPSKIRWGTTAHNWAKTWYAPLIFRPRLFLRGARLLFGDHAMFFRRADFLAVGGCDATARVMEDAQLCVSMSALGRVKLVPRFVETSDRRIAQWGALKANWIYLRVGIAWALGARPETLERHYPDVR